MLVPFKALRERCLLRPPWLVAVSLSSVLSSRGLLGVFMPQSPFAFNAFSHLLWGPHKSRLFSSEEPSLDCPAQSL